MSPARRFRVRFMLARELSIELDARDAQTAEDIAQYVLDEIGQGRFCATPEDIVTTLVDDLREVQS